MLGTEVCRAFSERHEIVPTHRQLLDLTRTEETLSFLRAAQPDWIVHTAAYTDVDGAEREPETAYANNVLATWNVALGAREVGAGLVYFSTDFVFDGAKNRPYHEFDAPQPVNVYGETKWAGEQLVRQWAERFFIVRTAGLFGPHGRHFVQYFLECVRRGEPLKVVDDQVCSHTATGDLARAVLELLESPLYGTYHLTNAGASSWYDFAREIVALANLTEVSLEPISSTRWHSPARRPSFSVLENRCWTMSGHPLLRPYTDALAEYLENLKV